MTGDCNEHGFDPQLDFSQFLEEAKNHTRSANSSSSTSKHHARGQEEKKNKSWKRSLFSWFKVDNKNKAPVKSSFPITPKILTSKRKSSVSGHIYGSERKAFPEQRGRRPVSGPLTAIFTTATRREEVVNVPYVGLDQLNHPIGTQLYGPVYLVT